MTEALSHAALLFIGSVIIVYGIHVVRDAVRNAR
jgi:hypothetical protein